MSDLKQAIQREYLKCAKDPVHFMRKYCTIQHPTKGKVKFDHVSVAMAFENLNRIKKYASKTSGANDQTKAHRKHLVYIIDKALDT